MEGKLSKLEALSFVILYFAATTRRVTRKKLIVKQVVVYQVMMQSGLLSRRWSRQRISESSRTDA